jgi:phospholipase/carboxylesterase
MTSTLDGPRRGPQQLPVRQLIVLLHGYGADGNDLIGLADPWAEQLPHALFLSPHAPRPCAISPRGREWFPLASGPQRTAEDVAMDLREGVAAAADALNAFLDRELAAVDLDDRSLGLVGFSQGAAVALHLGLRRPAAAILAYSGAMGPAPAAVPEPKPQVFLAHGELDNVVPVTALRAAVAALAAAGVSARWHLSPGLAHGIDGHGVTMGGRFLRETLQKPAPAG